MKFTAIKDWQYFRPVTEITSSSFISSHGTLYINITLELFNIFLTNAELVLCQPP